MKKMPRSLSRKNKKKYQARSFTQLWHPLLTILETTAPLKSRGNRPLQMDFDHQLKALVFFHLEEHTSGRHLLQTLQEDDFASQNIAPPKGIRSSSFFEAMADRGLEQFTYVFQELQQKACGLLPKQFPDLGELVAIDGSLIDAVLSMTWADYRHNSKKAKVHVGFDLNRSIPQKLFLSEGKGGERPFIDQVLAVGQTGVMDRGYQCHKTFDQLQRDHKHFVCRIKTNTVRTALESYTVSADSIVFYDAKVKLGKVSSIQTELPLRLVGYRVETKEYWVATDRFDLSAEQIAQIYKLRWAIEKFFAWWKRHLRVYHLISRSPQGLMVQILSGLITYLLLAIYCCEQHGEMVSIKRVRELRCNILNECRATQDQADDDSSDGSKPDLIPSEGLQATS